MCKLPNLIQIQNIMSQGKIVNFKAAVYQTESQDTKEISYMSMFSSISLLDSNNWKFCQYMDVKGMFFVFIQLLSNPFSALFGSSFLLLFPLFEEMNIM